MKHFVIILLTLFSAVTASAYDFMAGDIAYNINSDGKSVTVTYTKYGNNYPGTTDLTIPEKVFYINQQYTVTAIGDYAFYECASLTSLNVASSVVTIGDYAAFGCEKLSSLTLGAKLKTIGQYAFSETALASLELPLSVTSVGNYAFAGCSALANFYCGDGVQSIGRSAFMGCTALKSATLGLNVRSIGTGSFSKCTSLGVLNVNMPNPLTVDVSSDSFDGVDKSQCLLFVPLGTSDAYRAAAVWQEFEHINDVTDGYRLSMAFESNPMLRTGLARLDVGLDNIDDVSAVKCDIVLPQGMKVTTGSDGYDVILNEERRGRDHAVTVNCTATNTYTILVSSPSGKNLKGNSGIVFSIGLSTADMPLGYHNIYARNASAAKPSSELLYLNESVLLVNISRAHLLGDANGDGIVDVSDYVVTANKLIGKRVTEFYNDAADVNHNGNIDLGDLVGITQRAIGRITPEVIIQN